MKECHDRCTGAVGIRDVLHLVHVDHNMGAILRVELPELYEDRRASRGMGAVRRGWRVSNVRSCGEVAVLIRENTIKHDILLATCMGML